MPVYHRILSRFFVITCASLFSISSNALEWNGQSLFSDDWTDSGNWALCGLGCDGPESDETADFGALGIRTTPNVDVASTVLGLKFEFGARAYEISGARLTIGSEGIKNFSNRDEQIINTDITLSADQAWRFEGILVDKRQDIVVNGDVNINRYTLELGNQDTNGVLISNFLRQVIVNGDMSGSGNLNIGTAKFTGSNRLSGNINLFDNDQAQTDGSVLSLEGASARINSLNGNYSNLVFFGEESGVGTQNSYGAVNVRDGARLNVDRVTAGTDYYGRVHIGEDSDVSVGLDDSSFTMNTLITGDNTSNKGRFHKEGTGTVTINTYSFDGDGTNLDFTSTVAPTINVKRGVLKLTGNHVDDLEIETAAGTTLELDVESGEKSAHHSIGGSGLLKKTGFGSASINTNTVTVNDIEIFRGNLSLRGDHLNSYNIDVGEFTNLDLNVTSGSKIIQHNISGIGSLSKSGAGEAVLDTLLQQEGEFDLQEGAVTLGRDNALSDQAGMNISNGTLNTNGFNASTKFVTFGSGSGGLNINGGQLTIGETGKFSSVENNINKLTGNGTLVKTGWDKFVLNDADDFTGTLVIEQGLSDRITGGTNAISLILGEDLRRLEIVGGQRTFRSINSHADSNITVNQINTDVTLGLLNQFTGEDSHIAGEFLSSYNLTKEGFDTLLMDNATTFQGNIILNQGILATGTSQSFRDDIDVFVKAHSTSTFYQFFDTYLDVNTNQGFGAITGDGVVDFTGSSISVGNGDKSSVFNGTFRSLSFGSLTKNGTGKVTLQKDQDYRGQTIIRAGELEINGKLPDGSGNITVDQGATLSGRGQVGRISGTGTIAPGNSPGILTTHSIITNQGIDFALEFTGESVAYSSTINSINDVVRMTDFSSLTAPLTAQNELSIYLDLNLLDGTTIEGGFFSRRVLPAFYFENADLEFYLANSNGSEEYDGKSYTLLDMSLWDVEIGYLFKNVRFAGDNFFTSGYITTFTFDEVTNPVPLPAAVWLLLSGLAIILRQKAT